MPANNFQIWDQSLTNIYNDAAYTADAQRLHGAVVSGLFPSGLANKLFLQVSMMCAALAGAMWVKNYDMLDSDLTNLQASLSNIVTNNDVRPTVQNANLAGSRGLFATPNPDTTPPSSSIYQNTSGRTMMVTMSADVGSGGFHGVVYCDGSSSPATQIAQFARVNAGSGGPNFYPASVTFVVLPNYYYGISVTSGGGVPFVRTWTEWLLPW